MCWSYCLKISQVWSTFLKNRIVQRDALFIHFIRSRFSVYDYFIRTKAVFPVRPGASIRNTLHTAESQIQKEFKILLLFNTFILPNFCCESKQETGNRSHRWTFKVNPAALTVASFRCFTAEPQISRCDSRFFSRSCNFRRFRHILFWFYFMNSSQSSSATGLASVELNLRLVLWKKHQL